MNIIVIVSGMIIPVIILFVVVYGIRKNVDVYDEFIEGAKDGIGTVVSIVPTLIGLMVAVGILRTSGFLDFLSRVLGKVTDFAGFPPELVPLAIVRLFSSSAATGLSLDIYKEYGTDSYLGIVASIMMSCTETVFYTMSVYFMAAKVKKTRWTLAGALAATLAGIAASVVIGQWIS
ncbi:MAG: spore maturation protein [Eubacteriales bacterium]|nr:spore maturation protein [Eubacteriales bacterium]